MLDLKFSQGTRENSAPAPVVAQEIPSNPIQPSAGRSIAVTIEPLNGDQHLGERLRYQIKRLVVGRLPSKPAKHPRRMTPINRLERSLVLNRQPKQLRITHLHRVARQARFVTFAMPLRV
jgi:hypothetical protein